jgi:Holliday junction resolvase
MRFEKDIQKEMIEWLKGQEGIYWIKTAGSAFQRPGIPDLIMCVDGIFVALEIKRNKKAVVSLAQVREIGKINAAGGFACVVTSIYELSQVISQIRSV